MSTIKVSQLAGALLDYWVARAEGITPELVSGVPLGCGYSQEWVQGGPIIERELIDLEHSGREWREDGSFGVQWEACMPGGVCYMSGDTALIAAMRSYVVRKFGEEVPDAVVA